MKLETGIVQQPPWMEPVLLAHPRETSDLPCLVFRINKIVAG